MNVAMNEMLVNATSLEDDEEQVLVFTLRLFQLLLHAFDFLFRRRRIFHLHVIVFIVTLLPWRSNTTVNFTSPSITLHRYPIKTLRKEIYKIYSVWHNVRALTFDIE